MKQKRSRCKGNAMVEFAIIAAVLIPVFVGVFEFGYAFYTYNRLVGAVRSGARYASLLRYDSTNATPSADYQSKVKNMVVFGNPSGTGSPIIPNITTDRITVVMSLVNTAPDRVSVAVSNFTVDTLFVTLNWSNKPRASFRYQGQWAPL